MLVSQKLAIAAHMHVLLRRKTGRVTDTEWMAENLAYALEVVRFARVKAAEDGHPELAEWADKLERAVVDPTAAAPRQPLVQNAVQALRERGHAHSETAPIAERTGGFAASTLSAAASGFSDSGTDPEKKKDPAAPRYVGGIR